MAQQAPVDNAQAPDQTPPPPGTQPADPNANPATMQPVTVTGSRPSEDFQTTKASLGRLGAENLMDVPQTVVVINRALMNSQAVTTLEQAVRNVPGVTVGAAEGGTIGTNINIDGFSARTDIYLDGMRDRAQYYRDTFALESVEVLLGPSSMLFGRGSTGGIINQVTKKPGLAAATELSLQGTTNGLVRTTADVTTPFGENNAVRVNGMFQYGKSSTLDMTNVMDFGLAPVVKLGIGTPTEITLGAILQHKKDQIPYGVPPLNGFPINVPRNTEYGNSDDYTEQDVIQLMSMIEHKFNPDFKARNQTSFVWVNTSVRETGVNGVGVTGPYPTGLGFLLTPNGPNATAYSAQPLNQLVLRQNPHDRNINDITFENQSEIETKFKTGPAGHLLLMGVDVDYESYTNKSYSRSGFCNGIALGTNFSGCVPAGFTVGGGTPANAPDIPGNYASSQALGFGAYFNDTIQATDWLKLVAGVRWDVYSAAIGNSINSVNTAGSTVVPYQWQTDFFTSVRTGAIFEPTRAMSFYFSYSTSFNPSLEQLTSTTGAQNLPPENNINYEVGAKFEFLNGNLSTNGALFQITKNNARTQNADGTFSPTGTVQVQGARVGAAGRITPEWQVFGGFAYLNARITQGITNIGGVGNTTGFIPLNTPTYSGNVWTTYTINDTYEVGGGMFYVGQRYANNQNTVQVPEYFRFDMTAAYKTPKWELRANVFNLFNVMYYDQLMASDGGRAVPGSGTTGLLTFTYRM
jgi:catecholate siderophore receptor